jgi:hypothetical protein
MMELKSNKQFLGIVIAIVIAAALLFAVFSAFAPGINTMALGALQAATATPPPTIPPGEVIPLKPLSDLESLNATVKLNVNGLMNGKRVAGDLNAVLTANDQNQSQITVTGSLLGDVAAQVGGSLVGLFTPKQADVYKVPQGTFVTVNGLFPVCVKPNAPKATAALDELSPQGLMTMLTAGDAARGEFVGDETLNGTPVKHYRIDGEAFLAAAQKSSNENLRTFAESIWRAEDADLYVDANSGYPVSFRGSYSGTFEPLKFEGDFDVQIDLTGVNTNTSITLPTSCNNPISQ